MEIANNSEVVHDLFDVLDADNDPRQAIDAMMRHNVPDGYVPYVFAHRCSSVIVCRQTSQEMPAFMRCI